MKVLDALKEHYKIQIEFKASLSKATQAFNTLGEKMPYLEFEPDVIDSDETATEYEDINTFYMPNLAEVNESIRKETDNSKQFSRF